MTAALAVVGLLLSAVSPDRVRVELCEGAVPAKNEWPAVAPPVSETYSEEAFGFVEVPHKYIDTGVRGDRGHPYLLRATATVTLPPGKHRLLLRARGATKLRIDGRDVLTTPFPPPESDGHRPVPDPAKLLDLGPDFRFAPPGNREAWVPFESSGRPVGVVLETVVGSFTGKARRRPELGETVVAWSPAGTDRWQLLSPGGRVVPYTDAGWAGYAAERAAHYERVNATARAAAREKHRPYWDGRRKAAADWLASTPEVAVPKLPAGYPANNPIDHFLADTIARVARQAARRGTVDYFRQVQPVLEARCYGCHAGTKAKGGLRLDDRTAAVKGGKGDGPAITPGKPDESAILARVRSTDDGDRMPPQGEPLTKEQTAALEAWVREGAVWPDIDAAHTTLTPAADDLAFLRRATLDTVGVVPSPAEIDTFLADPPAVRRTKLIDRLLADPRWADHQMGYWQDVLAENPNILNPTLNNTGPFRWWLHESFADNKPADLMVTELVRMQGSVRFGGPAGFGVASQNDAPFAAKAAVVASAFLGVEMKCARCHDSPSHRSLQRDVFELAALLATKPQPVPATSSVPLDKIHAGGRKPLIAVTLKPGTVVDPRWPFAAFVAEDVARKLAERPADPRDRLAAALTAPANERFAQVLANRVWQRLTGRGLVEPADDWEKGKPTHPELLRWLGREFVRGGYDFKHLTRLVMNSHAYGRAVDPGLKETPPLFTAPARRRLTAEQAVDSLFAAAGVPMRTEEVSLDIDNIRDLNSSISLGQPRRAWMMSSTSNERDRPSLALPRVQAVVDVLQAFGWRGSRQEPLTVRDPSPNVLQPAVLANGTMGTWVTRLSDDHAVTALAVREQPLDALIDAVYLRLLTRRPTAAERAAAIEHLRAGYESRVRAVPPTPAKRRPAEKYVSWSNHLDPEATIVRQKQEAAARAGDPPTPRLDPAWRTRMEDVVWAVVNSPEFLFTP